MTVKDWIIIGLCVACAVLVFWNAVVGYFLARLTKERIEFMRDSVRLDWLEKRVDKEVINQDYGNPYGEWVANTWQVTGPYTSLREACDHLMKDEQEGNTCEDEGCPNYGTPHGHIPSVDAFIDKLQSGTNK